jgi:hypothetical protein
MQHYTRTLDRNPDKVAPEVPDFRLPTDEELDAVEAFQLSLGRQQDLVLPLAFKPGSPESNGQIVFREGSIITRETTGGGTCRACHNDAGAVNGQDFMIANRNFNTGVEDFLRNGTFDVSRRPCDGGFGKEEERICADGTTGFGNGTFNPQPLVEAADTAPFFHNNAAQTLEEVIEFYHSPEFIARFPTALMQMNDTEKAELAAFLRVLNVMENERAATATLNAAKAASSTSLTTARGRIRQAQFDILDAINVLNQGGLFQGDAVPALRAARGLTNQAARARTSDAMNSLIDQAIGKLREACNFMGDGNACPITF